MIVDVLVRTGVLELSNQAGSFVGASAAFVVGVIVAVIVSMVTQPQARRRAGRADLVADVQGRPQSRAGRCGDEPCSPTRWRSAQA